MPQKSWGARLHRTALPQKITATNATGTSDQGSHRISVRLPCVPCGTLIRGSFFIWRAACSRSTSGQQKGWLGSRRLSLWNRKDPRNATAATVLCLRQMTRSIFSVNNIIIRRLAAASISARKMRQTTRPSECSATASARRDNDRRLKLKGPAEINATASTGTRAFSRPWTTLLHGSE